MNNIKKIKGTLDLFNNDIDNINKLKNIIKNNFILYGFKNIETPSIENKNIIKLIKKNLNIPLYYSILEKKNNKFLIFDLTISLIRFLLTNTNNINFPFKRYQIQKVWRGEKPQNNRYREFYQCDVDIISYKYNLEEIEIISLCDKIFNDIKLNIDFLINHKDILYGLCEYLLIHKNKWEFIIKTIDKLNKIGKENVKNILIKKIDKKYIKKIFKIFEIKKNNINYLLYLKKKFNKNKLYGKYGIKKLLNIFKIIKKIKLKRIKVKFNLSLSRGLNYYSKTIFEIKLMNKKNDLSLGGGGRYDNIIKINNKKIHGIGISLGLYRIYNTLKLYNNNVFTKNKNKKVIILNFDIKNYVLINKYANILRNNNIITEIFLYKEKIKKQIKYAIRNKFNYLIIIGEKEINKNIIKIKNLKNKKENIFYNIKDLIKYINY
ncbi:histidine--tRNA ligase [Candidatus Shikimatogenerans bostrichidophilus]|uniref:histidine--tRNA ligase n=1 Tax=Candidatus Shikimatogenerans bostrichidophilus TaxID=2943807 RepID=UPI00296736FE